MGHYAITPSDPKLQAMFTLTVHQSLGDGIVTAGVWTVLPILQPRLLPSAVP